MIIWRFKPVGTTNFGDALNDYLWPKMLNPKLGQLPGYFYGIGTVLRQKMPEGPHYVFGAGLGYGGVPVLDESWQIFFVRGPHTASHMGKCPWITDPGILVRQYYVRSDSPSVECAFMPRWDATSEELFKSCDKAGIKIIDPRWSVEQVLAAICDTKLLLTEALHGAVCADSLGTPWISIYGSRGHEFKWRDWTASMDMVWNPIDAVEYTLSWARDFAVPQLSARSVADNRFNRVTKAVEQLNADIDRLAG